MMKTLLGKKLFLAIVNVCVREEFEELTTFVLRQSSFWTVLMIDDLRCLHIDAASWSQARRRYRRILGFAVGGLALASYGEWRYQSRCVGDSGKFLGSWNHYTPLLSMGTSFPTSVSHLAIVDAGCNTMQVPSR